MPKTPEETPAEPDWITTQDAAKLLDVHPQTIRRMISAGVLTSRRRGLRQLEVRRAQVLATLEPQERAQ